MGIFNRRAKAHKLRSLDELEAMIASGRPILLDFHQVGCAPCQVMDGIVDELAAEYGPSAHVVKVDVRRVPGALTAFKVRSTPTFVLLGRRPDKKGGKGRRRPRDEAKVTQRWRATGLVKKDQLRRLLESNGARPAE